MSNNRQPLTRADLPDEFTPDTIRDLPMGLLRRLSNPANGILDETEQAQFNRALRQMMSETAHRVSGQMSRSDWERIGRQTRHHKGPASGQSDRQAKQLRRLEQSIRQQVELAEQLAPDVDWSFAGPVDSSATGPATRPDTRTDSAPATTPDGNTNTGDNDTNDDSDTVSDLENQLTEDMELVQVMSEIADMSRRTYALEQQRDLSTTRGLFFGFVVSLAVLVAGWAPLVTTKSWPERLWTIGLTLVTCALAGGVYMLVRRWQNAHPDPAQPE